MCLLASAATAAAVRPTVAAAEPAAARLFAQGSYCEYATSDKSQLPAAGTTDVANPMLPCPPGYYCPKGTYIPIAVPRGGFAPGEGNSIPSLCLPGTYSPYEGFHQCLPCPAGYECRLDGTYKPVICPPGKFRSLRDSITCVNCPMGTWSPFTGVTDRSLCWPYGVHVHGGKLAVADSGNNRVMLWSLEN